MGKASKGRAYITRVGCINKNAEVMQKHTKRIFKNEQYFYCQISGAFLSIIPGSGAPLRFGILLTLWQYNQFLDVCPTCNGTVYLQFTQKLSIHVSFSKGKISK